MQVLPDNVSPWNLCRTSHFYPWGFFARPYKDSRASQVVPVVKNTPANAGDAGLIPGEDRWEDRLEKGMATHSSILAWRIPWTEEPGGLQSMGSQRVRHD